MEIRNKIFNSADNRFQQHSWTMFMIASHYIWGIVEILPADSKEINILIVQTPHRMTMKHNNSADEDWGFNI